MRIEAAVVRTGSKVPRLETLELERPRAGEILVRVEAAGVCHTDIRVAGQERFPRPIVLGHEGAGVVEEAGEGVEEFRPGDRVIISYAFCGHCPLCRRGAMAYCTETMALNFSGRRLDGTSPLSSGGEVVNRFFGQSSFASHVVCDAHSAIRAPDDIPLSVLAPLGCGIQTGAGAVVNSLKLQPGQSVAVFGAGSVGLSAVMAASALGASQVIAVDINPGRLALARELGATAVVDPRRDAPADAIRDLTGLGVDIALNTTDRAEVYLQGIASLAPLGAFGFVTAPSTGELSLNLSPVMLGGRSIRGLVQGDAEPRAFIPRLIELYREGRFPLDRLVTPYPFEEVAQALEDSEAGVSVKPVLQLAR